MNRALPYIKKLLKYLVPALIVLVTVMSFLPPSKVPSTFHFFPHEDKILHAGAYFIIAFIMMLAFAKGVHLDDLKAFLKMNRRTAVVTAVSLALLGGIIEVLQPYAGRAMEILDLCADIGGALLGIAAALCILRTVIRRMIDA